ncbi:MAG: UDP-N-acetylmuramoyl-L-alanyl-D-glutamate--2,6-diaminopimelate ligase [Planctomycetes bacterium]|nr:UDP-N-acetylmuramoyl-L-alanyl-D-glutamate--2,6-diaminopimelate ligase [Planctomycetota bacterium]
MKLKTSLDHYSLINILSDLIVDKNLVESNRYTYVTDNSTDVKELSIFVAVSGTKSDGNNFVDDAIKRGAKLLITERRPDMQDSNWIQVSSARKAIAKISTIVYGDPSRRMNLMGVTGTNGKSTTAVLMRSIIEASGHKCALIGTIFNYNGKTFQRAVMTTPDSDQLNSFLSESTANGCDYAVMEVSSHSLDQDRVGYMEFCGAIFTNLTHDHLDYHKSKEQYAASKSKLFSMLPSHAIAAINKNDTFHDYMLSQCRCGKAISYGASSNYDIKILSEDLNSQLLSLTLNGATIEIKTNLIGSHNALNILAVSSLASGMGIQGEIIRKGVESVRFVPGRLQSVDYGQGFKVFVDYAHTPSALEAVLKTLRKLTSSKLIVVFGCGGDRDKTKRAPMGKVVAEFADYSIVTNDNPRSESPEMIADEILKGFGRNKYDVILDRQEAIKKAFETASVSDDVIVIAGKGHEDYQIIGNKVIHFDDREICHQLLRDLIVRKACVTV